MACLSPEALVRLWTEMMDHARKNRLGVFGVELSSACRARIDADWDSAFGEKRVQATESNLDP